jgi:hypothetical protein
MIRFMLVAVTLISIGCNAGGIFRGDDWLRRPTGNVYPNDGTAIPEVDVYEVTHSKIRSAMYELAESPIREIKEERARLYVDKQYNIRSGKKPFLLRGVYNGEGFGTFELRRIGDDLMVVHGSLGHGCAPKKTVLVANLDYSPKSLFIVMNVAE